MRGTVTIIPVRRLIRHPTDRLPSGGLTLTATHSRVRGGPSVSPVLGFVTGRLEYV